MDFIPTENCDEIGRVLCHYASKCNLDGLRRCANTINVNYKFAGATPLMRASEASNNEGIHCVNFLLSLGGNPGLSCGAGVTAVHCAAAENNQIVLRTLLRCKNRFELLDLTNKNGDTPLMWAAARNAIDTVKLLIKLGADKKFTNNRGVTAMDFARQYESWSTFIWISNELEQCPFNNMEKQQMLKIENDGMRLCYLAEKGEIGMGLNSNCNCRWMSMTALMWAAKAPKNRGANCVIHLLKLGADYSLVDWKGWTPVHHAAYEGNEEILLLLKTAVPANHRDKLGRTPLMVAAYFGIHSSVQTLIQLGASVTCVDVFNKTAMDMAQVCGHTGVIVLLRRQPNGGEFRETK